MGGRACCEVCSRLDLPARNTRIRAVGMVFVHFGVNIVTHSFDVTIAIGHTPTACMCTPEYFTETGEPWVLLSSSQHLASIQ